MSKVPSLTYIAIVKALQRDGWIVVRQIPAHRPVKRSTLAHILKQARMTLEHFLSLL